MGEEQCSHQFKFMDMWLGKEGDPSFNMQMRNKMISCYPLKALINLVQSLRKYIQKGTRKNKEYARCGKNAQVICTS